MSRSGPRSRREGRALPSVEEPSRHGSRTCRPPVTRGPDPRFDPVWREDRGRMLGLARRMLGDATEAEDVVQEAFGRLARVDLDELEDVGVGSRWSCGGSASIASVPRASATSRPRSARCPTASSRSRRSSPPIRPIASRSTIRCSSRSRSCSTGSRPRSAPRSSCTTSSASPTRPSARSSDARPPRAASSRAGPVAPSGTTRR